MARRLFTLLSALSLLLCVATAVLWVRSYWREDFLTRARPGGATVTSSTLTKGLCPCGTTWS